MNLKFLFLCFPIILWAQKKNSTYTFGTLTPSDKTITQYENDPEANALVLYEEGNNHFELINGYVRLVTKNYYKIKLFKKEGFKHATVSIPLYRSSDTKERLEDLKAITHINGVKTYLSKKEIFENKRSEHWNEVVFTLPNLAEQCIIEYEYTTTSPYLFNLSGWRFQSDIPKLASYFTAKIPGNYVYNRKLNGPLKLTTNKASVKEHCFSIPGTIKFADCELLQYGMKNIPAFKEEKHMLAAKNYISKIKFELSEKLGFTGIRTRYTKTWKDVDKEFKFDKNIGRQSKKNNFFKNILPQSILTINDDLKKAKAIYDFIQQHFHWNGKYGLFRKSNVKKAFDSKKGNISEINLSLTNALNAAGLSANFVLTSTRNNGLPTRKYPVITDFNYLVCKLDIGDQSILLDASDKTLPFGFIPLRSLNYLGRVMDFEKGSYWMDILPYAKNLNKVFTDIQMNNEGKITTRIKNLNTGYLAIKNLKEIIRINDKSKYGGLVNSKNDFELTEYNYLNKVKERYNLNENLTFSGTVDTNGLIEIYPFVIEQTDHNPFQLKERSYPIDFAFPFEQQCNTQITIPEGYDIISAPESQVYKMTNSNGTITLNTVVKANKIKILLAYKLPIQHIKSEHYQDIKAFFDTLVKIQSNSPIILKKKLNN